MAHGFECRRCGHYEASHGYPADYPGICSRYISPDKRAENAIWKAEGETPWDVKHRDGCVDDD